VDWLTFWIAALATCEICVLIARSSGPFRIFARAREAAVKRSLQLDKLLRCPMCLGPWVATPVVLTLVWGGQVGWWILFGFALAALVTAYDRVFTSDMEQQ
jgi:hypothetical protein